MTLDGKLLGATESAEEVDLLENTAASSTATATPEGFRVKVAASSIASVKVSFRE